MSFTVSSLSAYTDQLSKDLLVATQFGTETAGKGVSKQFGVKSAAALQLLAADTIPQDGTSCGFNASGSVTLTQATLTTYPVKFQDELCPRTLEAKWTQILLTNGQNYDESSITKAIWNEIKATMMKRIETCDWQGDTTAGSAYLNRYDGLVKILSNASGVNSASSSTFNSTNARTIMKNILNTIPAALKGNPDVKVFCGYDVAEIYRQALMDANLYHVAVNSNDQRGIYVEGSVVELVPVHGLDGLNTTGKTCIFALNPKNVFLGADMMNEEEELKMWYSQDNDIVRYSVRFRRGWQVAYGAEVVKYANS